MSRPRLIEIDGILSYRVQSFLLVLIPNIAATLLLVVAITRTLDPHGLPGLLYAIAAVFVYLQVCEAFDTLAVRRIETLEVRYVGHLLAQKGYAPMKEMGRRLLLRCRQHVQEGTPIHVTPTELFLLEKWGYVADPG